MTALQKVSLRKSIVFIAVTHLLMDIIPKITQLSLFFQKDEIDLAMIRPSVDSVVQQLTWLKTSKANSTNLYPATKGYLRETCKSHSNP